MTGFLGGIAIQYAVTVSTKLILLRKKNCNVCFSVECFAVLLLHITLLYHLYFVILSFSIKYHYRFLLFTLFSCYDRPHRNVVYIFCIFSLSFSKVIFILSCCAASFLLTLAPCWYKSNTSRYCRVPCIFLFKLQSCSCW